MTELIGNAPVVYLNRVLEGPYARIAAKLESANPLASVKDRIGLATVEAAEREGKIHPSGDFLPFKVGDTIDPSSGAYENVLIQTAGNANDPEIRAGGSSNDGRWFSFKHEVDPTCG